MTNAMPMNHSDAEVLAAFVDGQLTGEELQAVTSHLAECEECRMSIGDAVAFEEEEEQRKRPSRRAWWAAVAAVAVLAMPGYVWYGKLQLKQSVRSLYVAQGENERLIAGRLTDQTPYATWRSTTRGDAGPTPDTPLAIQKATADIEDRIGNSNSQEALRAKAAAQAATEPNPSNALATLESIPEGKRDAATWNDLAAVRLGKTRWVNDPDELLKQALAAADEALRLRPNMPEALFNRAMILKKMKDPRAQSAINDYLAVDPQSKWAHEVAKQELPELR